MGAAGWNVETVVRLGIQHVAVPDSEGRRAFAQVDDHVKDRAGSDPDELALGRLTKLVVQSTQYAFRGAAVITTKTTRARSL